jgi:putative PIN family toxin of toxin-antitoxin system
MSWCRRCSGAAPRRLRETILVQPEAQLFNSPTLLAELAEVLARPKAAKRLALIGRSLQVVLADYTLAADVVTALSTPSVVADDADDHVIAAAVAAQANLIVSGDRHLLTLGRHRNIRFVSSLQPKRLPE